MFGRRSTPTVRTISARTPSTSSRQGITGLLPGAAAAGNSDAGKDPKAKPAKPRHPVNVVLVADFDMLTDEFFRLREQGEMPERGINFDFDNVAFVLNAIDSLAGEDRFLELRKRRPKHRTLTKLDERLEEARKLEAEARDNLRKEKDDNIRRRSPSSRKRSRSSARGSRRTRRSSRRRREPRGHGVAGGPEADRGLQEGNRTEVQREDRRHQQPAGRQGPGHAGLVYVLGRGDSPDRALALAGFVFIVRRTREREGVGKVAPAVKS